MRVRSRSKAVMFCSRGVEGICWWWAVAAGSSSSSSSSSSDARSVAHWGLGSSGGDDVGGKCWYEPVHLSEVKVQERPGAHVAEQRGDLKYHILVLFSTTYNTL